MYQLQIKGSTNDWSSAASHESMEVLEQKELKYKDNYETRIIETDKRSRGFTGASFNRRNKSSLYANN